ncbi:MAG: hypothetical protein BWY82_02544 [Verrucomicrobia bacterium ADurb.Bin474]|nr:MAG: hypothetical protein BWY82_02544 [Verrucomicrobia bacterium ADurb.Bin474]
MITIPPEIVLVHKRHMALCYKEREGVLSPDEADEMDRSIETLRPWKRLIEELASLNVSEVEGVVLTPIERARQTELRAFHDQWGYNRDNWKNP